MLAQELAGLQLSIDCYLEAFCAASQPACIEIVFRAAEMLDLFPQAYDVMSHDGDYSGQCVPNYISTTSVRVVLGRSHAR